MIYSKNKIQGLYLNSLKIIKTDGGEVLQAIKNNEESFVEFGEAYFSTINYKIVKGWKRHNKMTLNLIVPIGSIKFVIFDNRESQNENGIYFDVILSRKNYMRLTIPPHVWFAFQGQDRSSNTLLNIASIKHDNSEVDQKEIDEIPYDWK